MQNLCETKMAKMQSIEEGSRLIQSTKDIFPCSVVLSIIHLKYKIAENNIFAKICREIFSELGKQRRKWKIRNLIQYTPLEASYRFNWTFSCDIVWLSNSV